MHLITSQYYCVYLWYRRVPVASEMPRQKSRGIEEFLPSRRWRWIPPCCGASCLTYYAVLANARKPVIRFSLPATTPHAVENSCFERPRYGRPAEPRRQPRSSSIPLRSVTSKASSTARQERTTQYTMCGTRLKIYDHQARSKRASSV